MSLATQAAGPPADLASHLHHATGQSVCDCYQCGKCTAGCPLASEMDIPPHQVLRLLQIGSARHERRALESLSIWLCLTCEACAARCPQNVEIPRIMDHLRHESLRRNRVHPQGRAVLAFHRAFLASLRRGGRLHEVSLIADFKLRTLRLFQDVLLTPKLLARGKLKLRPPRIAGHRAIQRIFDRAAATGRQHPEEKP